MLGTKIPQELLQWNILKLEEKLWSADPWLLLHRQHVITDDAT